MPSTERAGKAEPLASPARRLQPVTQAVQKLTRGRRSLILKRAPVACYVILNRHRLVPPTITDMSRTLYTPKLSDDVVRALYREGRRRRMPMTRLADELLRQSLERHSLVPLEPDPELRCTEARAAA